MITPIDNYFIHPEFLKGYEEGYEAAKVDMEKHLREMVAFLTETATVSTN